MHFCSNCSVQIDENSAFCWKCGSKVDSNISESMGSNKSTTNKAHYTSIESTMKNTEKQNVTKIESSNTLHRNSFLIKRIIFVLWVYFDIDSIALAIILLSMEDFGSFYNGLIVSMQFIYYPVIFGIVLLTFLFQIGINQSILSKFGKSKNNKEQLIYLTVPIIHFFVLLGIFFIISNSLDLNYALASLIALESVIGFFYLLYRVSIYSQDNDRNFSNSSLFGSTQNYKDKIQWKKSQIETDQEKSILLI